jgi:dTDP-L-rhamnose 4-epimerase
VILVTGGAGFIGSHIVDALVCSGHQVRVLDAILPTAHEQVPGYMNPQADLIRGSLTDRDTVDRALRGVNAVCHQASMVGLGADMLDVTDYVTNNDLGTAILLERLAAGRFTGRLVLASSMVVYGEGCYVCALDGPVTPEPRARADLQSGQFDPSCPACGNPLEPAAVPESAPLQPRSVYAATKVHQEHLCFSFSRETGVALTALRYHNVYGPRMPRNTPYSGVAAIFASALAAGRAPRVFEDGLQLRDFVHVRDVAAANVIALTRSEPALGVFNIASGHPRTVLEMAHTLTATMGSRTARPLVTGEFRAGDVRHVFASPEKARRELGFSATEDFAAGMAEFGRAPLRDAA